MIFNQQVFLTVPDSSNCPAVMLTIKNVHDAFKMCFSSLEQLYSQQLLHQEHMTEWQQLRQTPQKLRYEIVLQVTVKDQLIRFDSSSGEYLEV